MDSTKTKLKKNDNNIINNNNNTSSIGGSKRFLLCFKPVVSMDHDQGGGSSGEPVFTYIAMAEKEGVVFPKILPGFSEDDHKKDKKKDGHRSLSRILKAVLFETSLVKKIKKRKLQQKLAKSEKISKQMKENSTQNQELSNSSSAITSSSLRSFSSSVSSNSRSLPDRNKSFWSTPIDTNQRKGNLQEHGKGCYSSNIGFCLLLISLLVLIFWGKICAIFCTSTWLFLVPRLCNDYKSSQKRVELPEIDSEEYKKRIIMEGLLERRNHARGYAAFATW